MSSTRGRRLEAADRGSTRSSRAALDPGSRLRSGACARTRAAHGGTRATVSPLAAPVEPPAGCAIAGNLTPSAAASCRIAAIVAANMPADPVLTGTPASTRYADVVVCPGQLNPNPFGITTSSRCL